MKKHYERLALVLLGPAVAGLLLATVLLARPVRAATLTVNTLTDEDDGCLVGNCSLRDAIGDANDGDVIDFSVSGTIDLSSNGQLVISKSVTISSSLPITMSGNGAVRVFKVVTNSISSVAVTFAGLTIAYGDDSSSDCGSSSCGGGLYVGNGTAVTLSHSSLISNTADWGGGIVNDGSQGASARLTLVNSTLVGNSANLGGGILNNGYAGGASLTLYNSTVISNSAASGAGIYNSGSSSGSAILTLNGSTLSNNNANSLGGGILSRGDFGSTSLTLNNSTLSANSAINGGGIFNDANSGSAGLVLNNSTLSANSATVGGGISNSGGDLQLRNTIIANSPSGGDCFSSSDPSTNINSLREDGSCDPAVSGDPLLGPLADNGGVVTGSGKVPFTHALLTGSTAIDAGDNGECLSSDQRGVGRPQDGDNNGSVLCDIGAYELEAVVTWHYLYIPLIVK